GLEDTRGVVLAEDAARLRDAVVVDAAVVARTVTNTDHPDGVAVHIGQVDRRVPVDCRNGLRELGQPLVALRGETLDDRVIHELSVRDGRTVNRPRTGGHVDGAANARLVAVDG